MLKRKGQIWIETVIYTLIGLAIIGLLLSIVNPAIERKKDQVLIENSLEMLSSIESIIEDVKYYGVGNTRTIQVKIKKGRLDINSSKDEINFFITSEYEFSEPGQEIQEGEIKILTTKKGKEYDILLSLKYEQLDLTWNDNQVKQIFQASPTPYSILVANKGKTGDKTRIDFS